MYEPFESTALYRLYDVNDQLLYVGISKNLKERWTQHTLTQPWWHLVVRREIEWLPKRSHALAAEETALRSELPKYNGYRQPHGVIERLRYDDTNDRRRATEQLRQDIFDGVLAPGDRLQLTHLAKRYGVSAATVSRALSALPEGSVEAVGNRMFLADPAKSRPKAKPPVVYVYRSTTSWC